jgi:hypothetical protein
MNRLAAMQLCPLFLAAGGRRHLRRLLEVRRRHDHERVAAAQLEHRRLERVPRDRRDRPPGRRAAGERRRRHPVVAQHLLDLLGPDQQRLEDVGREARPAEQLLEEQRRLRHVARVLEQPDVAGHQRGRGEAHRLPHREVPRHDRQHHARSAATARTPLRA